MRDSKLSSKSADPFRCLGLGGATLRSTERSAVTSAWGVDWSEELIARDLMQNFFDANRKQLEKIVVTARDRHVRVSAPAGFDLRHLFFLGSEKGEDDVGKYGEGFKAATVCILRRKQTSVIAASGKDGVIIRLSEEPAVGTNLYPLVYDFFELEQPVAGSVLIVDGAWRELCRAVEQGLTHFFYEQNPLVGELLAGDGRDFRLFRSTTDDGHIFYRNLRRGDIPSLPVVLVLNKEYSRIEKEVAKDRDRKAFGESVRDIFYGVWAKGFFQSWPAREHIITAAKPLWQQGRGHPLLAAIGRGSGYWRPKDTGHIFGNGYYAESPTPDAREMMRFSEIETVWLREGRIKLPSYFGSFGVISAQRHVDDLNEAAKTEARKTGAHRPTRAEGAAIAVLRNVLHELSPKIARLYEEKRTSYTIAATQVLLGEFKESRGYRSLEIFLAQRVFDSDFAEALAVFLHEHAHIHGYDGSRAFTDALTEILETVVRERGTMDKFEAQWEKVKAKVGLERRALAHERANDELTQLENFDREDLLCVIQTFPKNMVRAAVRKAVDKRGKA